MGAIMEIRGQFGIGVLTDTLNRDANRVRKKIRKNRKFISIAYKLRADGAKPPLRKFFDIFDAKNLILYAQFTGSPHPNFHFFAILYNFLQMLSLKKKKKKKKIIFFFFRNSEFFFLMAKNSESRINSENWHLCLNPVIFRYYVTSAKTTFRFGVQVRSFECLCA